MTRGKIIFIDIDGKAYCTCEFNGDMYPNGKASEILERFQDGYFENYKCFQRFVEHFNHRNFGYDEELIRSYGDEKYCMIDIKNNWTDYLYVINESKKEWIIIDKDMKNSCLSSHSIGIVYYQEVDKIIHRVIEEE